LNDEIWGRVDQYLMETVIRPDDVMKTTLAMCDSAGLPSISVSAAQGKLLELLVRIMNAKNVLEVGTLGGYSTIWMARALGPGGKVTTIEYDAKHADVARTNFERAGVCDRVELIVAKALDVLPTLASQNRPPFDLSFIDADKQSNAEYFDFAVKLSRKGALVIVDNVIRGGKVIEDSDDPGVQGVRRMNDRIKGDPRVRATTIQTVGAKNYDGLLFAVVV
jgi:predicted O-methyltransferase YrrM